MLHEPGIAGLSVLFEEAEYQYKPEEIEHVMSLEMWPDTHSFNLDDFSKLYHGLTLASFPFGVLAAAIQDRAQRSDFPLLLPEESDDPDDANALLLLVDQEEHVKIESFLEYHKNQHLESLPMDDDAEIQQAETIWVEDSYYSCLASNVFRYPISGRRSMLPQV